MALLLVTAGAVFAKAGNIFVHQDPRQDALALDCPQLNTRIIGAQTEIWPDVKTWEECGA